MLAFPGCSELNSINNPSFAIGYSKIHYRILKSAYNPLRRVSCSLSRAKSSNAASAAGSSQSMEAATRIRLRLEKCILYEAEEQRQQLERAYSKMPVATLIKEGILIVGLRGSAYGRLYGDLIWKFELPAPGQPLPRHKFRTGSNVTVRVADPRRTIARKQAGKNSEITSIATIEGTILECHSTFLLITFNLKSIEQLTQFPPNILFRIEQGNPDTTIKRQLEALRQLCNFENLGSRSQKVVRAILLRTPRAGELSAQLPPWMEFDDWKKDAKAAVQAISGVNKSQQLAIAAALSRCFTIWQGPPGTGKTRTLLAFLTLVCNLVAKAPMRRRMQLSGILAVADTNAAADNLVSGLLERNIDVVRIGRLAQVREDLRYSCLEARAENSNLGKRAAALRDQAAIMLTRVQQAASIGQASEKDVQQTQREANRLWAQAESQLKEAEEVILNTCQVVVGTCASAGEPRVSDRQFKVVVIDEATQATEPSTLIALTKGAECVVMAGDPQQLPPTVVSMEASKQGLDVPLFITLQNKVKLPVLVLNTQYRMHPGISQFPSQHFYNGQITSGVKPDERPTPAPRTFRKWIGIDYPIAFLECRDPEIRASNSPLSTASEGQNNSGNSYKNAGQAAIVLESVQEILKDRSIESLAILSPYNGQIRLLNSLLGAEPSLSDALTSGRLVISTVDGFQGREADVVVFTTVRSNPGRNLGFLADARRLNVAITRPRRGLVVVGCSMTLSASPHWAEWLDFIRDARS